MDGGVIIRPARDGDFGALSRMDLTYDASRVLALSRAAARPGPSAGGGVELEFALTWRDRAPSTALYNAYPEARLRDAVPRLDLFLVAEAEASARGLLMIIVPAWSADAGEITDLAVDRAYRRSGAGRGLVEGAVEFGRGRDLRSLWVEPRTDNASAIEFYASLGFRISGFNDRMYSNMDHEDGRTTLFMHLELRQQVRGTGGASGA